MGRRQLAKALNRDLSRRDLLRASSLAMLGYSACGWLPALANDLAASSQRRRQCILLWMSGGPSQTDTFDMKPNHENGGEFKEVSTNVAGLRISEHLPRLAQQADQLAIVRGLTTNEGDHGRGTYLVRTGQRPGGAVRYPAIGSALSKELGHDDAELPNYVSILPFSAINQSAFSPGFLGPRYAAATVGEIGNYGQQSEANVSDDGYAELGVDHLQLPHGMTAARSQNRIELWRTFQNQFTASHNSESVRSHDTVYRRAVRMMNSEALDAFDLSGEPSRVRDAYGRGRFGQGCLIARRLIERRVPVVEVTLGGFDSGSVGWDTHQDNFNTVRELCARLDAGWGTLVTDLADRGLLETTTILWIGEFGRTPKINANAGRDHFPNAWSCAFAGGGIRGGQTFGKTSDDGSEVVDGKVGIIDVLATLCSAAGVDAAAENYTAMGRPIKITDGAPIREILA